MCVWVCVCVYKKESEGERLYYSKTWILFVFNSSDVQFPLISMSIKFDSSFFFFSSRKAIIKSRCMLQLMAS